MLNDRGIAVQFCGHTTLLRKAHSETRRPGFSVALFIYLKDINMGRNCDSVDLDREKFENMLFKAIEQAGSQRQLAKMLGLSHGTINFWQQRKYWPSPSALKKMINYVNGGNAPIVPGRFW